MLERIVMREVASYNQDGMAIDNLQKINFIYGVNGSGKTTLTNMLQHPDAIEFSNSTPYYKNNIPIPALVYNKNFREQNCKSNIPGVFTLGKATIEEQNQIEEHQKKLQELRDEQSKKHGFLDKLKDELEKIETESSESFWNKVKKKYENQFKEAFAGAGLGSKNVFKSSLVEHFKNNKADLLTLEELLEKSNTIFGKQPVSLQALPLLEEYKILLGIEENTIWQKKIIGKSDVPIGRLIVQLSMNDWVNQGRQYIQDNDESCPFCQQQTISNNFRNQLEQFFDKSFIEDTGTVNKLTTSYTTTSEQVIHLLHSIAERERNNVDTKLERDNFNACCRTLASQLQLNKQHVLAKMKEPSRSLELVSNKELFNTIEQLLLEANRKINVHNGIVANLSMERANLVKTVWKFMVEEQKVELSKYLTDVSNKQKAINAISTKIKELDTQCIELLFVIQQGTKNLTSIQPSIDQINRILKSYGFLNFEIVPSSENKTQYQIQREDGTSAAPTLSEGEVTFITFLYFLQLCKGSITEKDITADRILVIDDPICSLDSNVLFVVSSLIKDIIRDICEGQGCIKQLILLTHNVYFHKEVSYECGNNNKYRANFWILRKNNLSTSIEAFGMHNPIQNSYQLLWKELQSKSEVSSITIQNIMRRILENYFRILGKMKDNDIISNFPTKEEQEICRSLICWINDGSHCFPDDLFIEHQEDQTEKYKKVFKDIFVHSGHEAHYKMMMSIPDVAEAPALATNQAN